MLHCPIWAGRLADAGGAGRPPGGLGIPIRMFDHAEDIVPHQAADVLGCSGAA